MIEPFEYEKTKSQVEMRDSTVKSDSLETSPLDSQLRILNNFKAKDEHQTFLEGQRPFTDSFQKEVGRVKEGNSHKSFYQDEAIAARGSMVSDYDVVGSSVSGRETASVLISKYLDSQVSYVPPQMVTVNGIDNLRTTEPVLQPGITFIDSRRNMAARLQ